MISRREKRIRMNGRSLKYQHLCDGNISRKGRKKGKRKIQEILAKNFPNLKKKLCQVQEG